MTKLTEGIWVSFTTSLIAFIAYTSQIFVIWPWFDSEFSWNLVALLLPFNILVGMVFWCYRLCVTIEPGRVPVKWEPDPTRGDVEVKRLTGGPRYCSKCSCYKPPRAHHCKTCGRCVLRMDHHCPWIANCVGHHNYAVFIRFLTWVDIACGYHFIMLSWRVWDLAQGGINTYLNEPTTTQVVFAVLNFVACVPVLLCVGIFTLYHYYHLWSNTTTIEAWEKDKVATLIRRGKIREIKYPYSLSPLRNIAAILGPSPLFWCWPSQPVPGDGLRFEIAQGSDEASALSWPPYDPSYPPRSEAALRRRLDSDSPFTYGGEGPNPALEPSNAQRRVAAPRVNPPWGPAATWSEDDEDDLPNDGGWGLDDLIDEDDRPLGHHPSARVRRGSEGYEVRRPAWVSTKGTGGMSAWEREEAVRRFEAQRRGGSGRME